jgi:hypothetical protein
MYNGIPIPALAMVDDIVSIAKCNSVEGVVSNIKTDEFIKRKKLESQVGDGKCQWVHIGPKTCSSSYVANGSQITRAQSYKYLGDHMSDGWETLYKKRHERATGYAVTCQAMGTEISLGYQIYAVVKLLHQTIFLNGTLVNMETWPHCNDKRIALFERCEQGLLRKALSAHSKTPIECLYLELGVVPFRYHLMVRRIMYYQTVMKRDAQEITKKVVESQKRSKINGDFYPQVSKDMEDLQVTEDDVAASKSYLKEKVDEQAKKHAFTSLHQLAKSHSKVNENLYENMDGMDYFDDPRFSPDLVNLLFKFRTRMYSVRNNFRNNYKEADLLCPLCKANKDTQEHLFQCTAIQEVLSEESQQQGVYSDIFDNDTDLLIKVARKLKEIIAIREELLQAAP